RLDRDPPLVPRKCTERPGAATVRFTNRADIGRQAAVGDFRFDAIPRCVPQRRARHRESAGCDRAQECAGSHTAQHPDLDRHHGGEADGDVQGHPVGDGDLRHWPDGRGRVPAPHDDSPGCVVNTATKRQHVCSRRWRRSEAGFTALEVSVAIAGGLIVVALLTRQALAQLHQAQLGNAIATARVCAQTAERYRKSASSSSVNASDVYSYTYNGYPSWTAV